MACEKDGYFYINCSDENILKLAKKSLQELQYFPIGSFSDELCFKLIDLNNDSPLYISEPSEDVVNYAIKKEPSNILNFLTRHIDVKHWEYSIKEKPRLFNDYIILNDKNKIPSPLWAAFLKTASEDDLRSTLRRFKRASEYNNISLVIRIIMHYYFNIDNLYPEIENELDFIKKLPENIVNIISKQFLKNPTEEVLKGLEKKVKALEKLYT